MASSEVYVVAKYDYRAGGAEELDLTRNERLTLLDDSREWWRVQNVRQQSGFVPSNYVRRTKPSILESLKNTLGRRRVTDVKPPAPVITGEDGGSGGDGGGSEPSLCITTVRFAYDAQQPDEVSLAKGDSVCVLAKSDDGWWKVRQQADGAAAAAGWYPSNYLVPPVADDGTALYSQPAETYPPTPADQQRRQQPLDVVCALYAYAARNDEELSFEGGDTLQVLERPAADPDWWRARNDRGVAGMIPRSYVEPANSGAAESTTPPAIHTPTDATPADVRARYSVAGPFADRPWYFGNITRVDCDKMLGQFAVDGDFLVRDSETNVSVAPRWAVCTQYSITRGFNYFRCWCTKNYFCYDCELL